MKFRRSRALVVYWESATLACFDCVSGRRYSVVPETLRFLNELDDWTSVRALRSRLGKTGTHNIDLEGSLRSLARLGLIERSGASRDWPWGPWMPEASFFHFGTRDGRYPLDL